mgnify:CR=1 FL=1
MYQEFRKSRQKQFLFLFIIFLILYFFVPKNENDTSGTPGYMAPEVMMKIGHGMACDLFAVGVIGYECMFGKVIFLFN